MANKTFKGSYVELRYNTYFAVYYVPKDVRHVIGKCKFYKSTKTSDLKLAETRASVLVVGWKAKVAAARLQVEDPIIHSALDLLDQSKDKSKSFIVRDIIDKEERSIREICGDISADIFKSVASGRYKPLNGLLNGWKVYQQQKGLKPKSIDQMYSDIEVLLETHTTTKYLNHAYVEAWIKDIALTGNLTASSVTRITGSCKNFFKYLQFIGEVPKNEINPFIVPEEYKISKKPNSKSINKTQSWLSFSSKEVVDLYNQAIRNKDAQLSDLILICAYTGARIEEICSLKCSVINLEDRSIKIVDAKTNAGERVIPIHSNILGKMEGLVKNSIDGFLLSGLTLNKYSDRSNAIGKRFGRLKSKMGFSERYVFHSIRKTFTTMLENAGVSENVAADILGHEKPRITYGLYSNGTSLEVKKDAIKKITYKFDDISLNSDR